MKFDVSNPKVRADFLETNGDHLFVIVIRSLATGTCGDAVFAIVKIDNKLNVTLSNLNKPDCQGEMYPVKIENIKIDKPKEYFRQISIGNFKFNLESFEWINKD